LSHGQPRITEMADTAVHLYYNYKYVVGATISCHSINTTTLYRSKITKSENTARYVCQEVPLQYTPYF